MAVHMTSAHPAFELRTFLKEARSLARAGWDVSIVVCHSKREVVDGVTVIGVPTARGRLGRIVGTTFRVMREAIATKAPICHFHDPELIPAGFVLKCLGRRIVYDVHEDLPRQILTKNWIHPRFRRLLSMAAELLETVAARCFDRIVAATPEIGRRFPQQKTVVVQNYPFPEELAPEAGAHYRQRPAVVSYIGSVTEQRGALEMVKAIGLVNDRLEAELHIAGRYDPASLTTKLATISGWHKTRALGTISRAEVKTLLGKTRVGLVVFDASPNHVKAQPNKLFEYMTAGIPVIASDFPLWREIVTDNEAGLVVDPKDPKAIADAIQWLLEHEDEAARMGRRGMEVVASTFNWAAEEKKLLAMYAELGGLRHA